MRQKRDEAIEQPATAVNADVASASTMPVTPSTNAYVTSGFWERLWRGGTQFAVFFIIVYAIYNDHQKIGAPADGLVPFYIGNGMRILIATIFSSLSVLPWFAAQLEYPIAARTDIIAQTDIGSS
jgi:hypothetical protein